MTIRFLISVVIALALAAPDAAGQIPCGYEITAVIQAPPCAMGWPPPTFGTAISPNGRYVVGHWPYCEGGTLSFLYDATENEFLTLPVPADVSQTTARDVNDAAVVVGTWTRNGVGQRGFIFESTIGKWVELPSQNGTTGWSGINAINSTGSVCGWRSLDDGGSTINPYNAFLWSAKTEFTDLGIMNGPNSWAEDISDAGVVIGTTGTIGMTNQRAFFYFGAGAAEVMPPAPNAMNSWGVAVHKDGTALIGGTFQTNPIVSRAFVYSDEVFLELPPLYGDPISVATGLNAAGHVSGASRVNASQSTAVVWINGNPLALNDVVSPPTTIILHVATDIAEEGSLIATGYDTATTDSVTVILRPLKPKAGDANCDQSVNVDDLLAVINMWGPCITCPADFDASGMVDHSDLTTVIENWTF